MRGVSFYDVGQMKSGRTSSRCMGWGVTGELHKSLASPTLIESLFAVVQEKIHRVKNWKGQRSQQILRWVASAIVAHRQKMRRVRGMAPVVTLVTALGPQQLAPRKRPEDINKLFRSSEY